MQGDECRMVSLNDPGSALERWMEDPAFRLR